MSLKRQTSTQHDPRRHAARRAFTLIELLVAVAIISMLISLLLPSVRQARVLAQSSVCLSNQRQIAVAARLYMDYNGGSLFHHHEGWVLDDGSQVDQLPGSIDECRGGGMSNSQAEKPWIIFFQPYLNNRTLGFCPGDPTKRSTRLAYDIYKFNGGGNEYGDAVPYSELAIAEHDYLTLQSYLLNSVFTHKSARYALEGALNGFATDTAVAGLKNRNLIMFSERNSEAMNASDNDAFGSVCQDDYDTWVGEPALVRWGDSAGRYAQSGWIKYNRHGRGANYIYEDGHAELKSWSAARTQQFPDAVVRNPLETPPR